MFIVPTRVSSIPLLQTLSKSSISLPLLFSLPLCRLSPISSLKQFEVNPDLYKKSNNLTFCQFQGNRPFPIFVIKVRISNIVSLTFLIFLTASISLSAASLPTLSSLLILNDPIHFDLSSLLILHKCYPIPVYFSPYSHSPYFSILYSKISF